MKNRYASVVCGGVDVHYKFSTVTFRDAAGRVVAREQLHHADREGLRAQLARWPKGIPIVLEASFGWGWLSDLMEEVGLKPQLSNCYKVEKYRQTQGWVKTNKKDADLLSMLPGETREKPEPWWQVWRAPADVRDRREWMRYRADMVALTTGTKNRIHAVFHRHGIFFEEKTDLFGGLGRRFLDQLSQDGRHAGGVLPDGARQVLRGLVNLHAYLRGQLLEVAKTLHGQLERDELAKRLDGIPGVGLILSHTLRSEIGDIGRFKNHRKLAAYVCLAPRSDETGEPHPGRPPLGRHLGERGNRTLKWAFIEAAHGAVKHGGKWRAMFDRVTDGGRKDRGRGYIKVARELVQVVYIVWSRNVAYFETPPREPRKGRPPRRSRKDSRPGTGQP